MKYTIPKVSKTTHLWYVHFRYEGKQFRYKDEFNKIADAKEKEMYFEEFAKSLHKQLKTGWNPNIKENKNKQSDLLTLDAFDLVLSIKKELLTNESFINLRCRITRFKKVISILGFENAKIVDLKNRHYEMVFDKTVEMFDLTDNAHNQYKGSLHSILNLLAEERILKKSFKLRIKSKKIIKTVAHVPASEKEMIIIKNHLLKNNSTFYYYWASMFFTLIRPTEMLKVRLSMINIEEKSIYLPGTITKNGIPRTVPINQYFNKILLMLNIKDLPQDWFLFGSANVRFSRISYDNLEYIPAPYKIPRKQATTLWKVEVKDFLGINVTLYSVKKSGANALILAGVSIGAIKDLAGHSSEVTTQIYITNLKEVNRKEIMEKGTDF